jgi:hypothetical protein
MNLTKPASSLRLVISICCIKRRPRPKSRHHHINLGSSLVVTSQPKLPNFGIKRCNHSTIPPSGSILPSTRSSKDILPVPVCRNGVARAGFRGVHPRLLVTTHASLSSRSPLRGSSRICKYQGSLNRLQRLISAFLILSRHQRRGSFYVFLLFCFLFASRLLDLTANCTGRGF